uniref:PiggyBac transposable element-derived protein domain-containing protein n=1 Tax=Neogobius melanostomus TaxID=47308 RepID=A0A8C6SXT8_9GOBI
MFLIAVVYTSVVKLHDHIDYWRKGWPFGFQFPGDAISRNNFELVRTTLSLCDPEEDDENEAKKGTPAYDKLFKIQPFYSELVKACKAHFQPHSNICVYERKAAKKQLKCGYRLFALADSLTGYTWNLHIDTGKAADTRGQTAVKNLLPVSVIGSGFTLYMDSLFSSPRLFTELLDQNIGCCGVMSEHHSEFPQNAKNDFSASPSRGDIRWLRKDKLLFVKWVDIREVAMCSTVHESFTGQVIKRPVEEGEGWVSKQFSCPDAVADFNRHMVGNDFEFSYSMPCTRIKCWERVLFYHLLDLAVVNSFILYKEVMKGKGQVKGLTQKEFRVMLCKEIYKFAKGCDPDARAAAPAPAADVLCMPVFNVPGNATAGRKTCKHCHTTTPIHCQKCLIPLCVKASKNCFKEWHELESNKNETLIS